ncbi:transmembrane protein 104 homolog [Megalopta genalis]|uniref:transmembrane protein 104 homolog n=1 Tax=Megalopta genalis TaxID=115081 RepID=UPI001443740A|nr:transmembrane protein 104 homolog isoform X1 [Megalopta genalis]XP_033333595.1 transmembrane protein 104 homolog isoform X1 [Megalopta genalis]
MPEQHSNDQYPTWVGLIYIFNLIVGTGALTLPAVFSRAGWALGLSIILILAFISFITVTFVIEVMASANAILTWRHIQHRKRTCLSQDSSFNESGSEVLQTLGESGHSNSDSEDTPLVAPFSTSPDQADMSYRYYIIRDKIEMGQMASIFFNKFGTSLFYLCFAIYLYGDLSIYGAAVAKTLANVACTYQPSNLTCNDTIPDTEVCWEAFALNRLDAYRIFLSTFVLLLGPFVFFNVQKTKYLQLLTSAMRWLAFTIMIVYALKNLIIHGAQGNPSAANIIGIPSLFGACIYSFMCHHSLPALVAPIANKVTLTRFLALDYFIIACFYLLLALTGAFAFEHLNDLYTLDFSPRGSGDCSTSNNVFIILIEYFLSLFPVFTLSTSYPIIAITLRNNLQSLYLNDDSSHLCLRKFLLPILAVMPSYLIAMSTKDLSILVGITGSYAGAVIQYLIPTFLVYYARQKTSKVIGLGVVNKFASPFSSNFWLIFVIIWAIACMILVSVNFVQLHFHNVGMNL